MAGRINEEDIAEVREKARIDEVVSDYVTLRNAGGGSMKGLCPFHDEKSPSFHVTPARQFFHCFGCGEGGDVIAFLMKIDGLSFVETVERLADKIGLQLRYEDGPAPSRPSGPPRARLIDAHKQAQLFYADQLLTPDAVVARQFLSGRGFEQDACVKFGVGFAPRDGEALLDHLRQKGFNDNELVVAGLVGHGRGYYDKFRSRLLWPIRDASGDTIGFGARRIFDDDRIEAKYLNTAETPIYKKSQVLYGLDLARRQIAKSSQAVVVEGYTDVMAAHLAGVETAVATCGTAFGDEHARVLRRFLHDHEEFRGEVIFTFDGDAAGQRAALKAFDGDQNFVSQTYVAVEPGGLDPCDLRLTKGDEAVRELIAGRQPLYRFVLGNVVRKYDLDRADGRVDAMREAARLVASVRDQSKVTAFAQEISRMIGSDIDTNRVLSEVRRAAARDRRGNQRARSGRAEPARPVEPAQSGAAQSGAAQSGPAQSGPAQSGPAQSGPAQSGAAQSGSAESGAAPSGPSQPAVPVPSFGEPRFELERETLKLLLQYPAQVASFGIELASNDFTHPLGRAVWEAVVAAGGAAAGAHHAGWVAQLRDRVPDPAVGSAITALAVQPLRGDREPDEAYLRAVFYRLQELTAQRRIVDVKSRLQRGDPDAADYQPLFAELMALETYRRQLRELAVGE